MARLVGVDLPRNKRMEVALTYIYGIGPTRAKKILEETKISPDLRTDDLTDEDIKLLRNALAAYSIEGDLRREVSQHIKRLQEIGSYRGLRHKRNLPCRGQRTKTNARTRRGKKTGPIANKKKAV
ncbi:30S ribosomal protein S13 [bacterium]|nr:30S ribosomal protein S13 [bacterium]